VFLASIFRGHPNSRLRGITLKTVTLLLLLMSVIAFCFSWRWPLVGDEGLIHYVVFMLGHGYAPYSYIKDINLPGAYLLDAFVIHVLGPGPVGERAYDLLLCVIGCLGAVWSTWPDRLRSLAALSASLLFVLIHLQDGLIQAGQRDFAMAVFAMCAYAILAHPYGQLWLRVFLFELLIGFTAAIKPGLLPLAVLPLFVSEYRGWMLQRPLRSLAGVLAGVCFAPVAAIFWLHSRSSLSSFYKVMATLGVLHSELPRKDIWFLIVHSLSPISGLFVLWMIAIILCKLEWTTQRRMLFFCVAIGLISCIAQGKGLPYHRYPFLFFLLILMSGDFYQMLGDRSWRRYLGVTFAVYALVISPIFLWRISRFDDYAPFEDALGRSLIETSSISGSGIQCLDTYVGCYNTLYRLRQTQSTGYLYDCYLSMPQNKLRDQYRQEFLNALVTSRPHTIVVTDQPCFVPHQGYQWIADWPELFGYLNKDYRMVTEWSSNRTVRRWNRPQTPAAFKIYILK
jgi:hypothetical protein